MSVFVSFPGHTDCFELYSPEHDDTEIRRSRDGACMTGKKTLIDWLQGTSVFFAVAISLTLLFCHIRESPNIEQMADGFVIGTVSTAVTIGSLVAKWLNRESDANFAEIEATVADIKATIELALEESEESTNG